ncbi:MAG TPA: NHL repeat-containing protein [Leptospiraceae bacterium]|nr:NHL repeat-containing protein [Leptospiraceae bacterium]HMY34291.1 NHL repeat-containing protein [Leptospiraceae bacterium]HMZ64091.1 NHL repeat-containing protein [Leptospiraceae bacterium]HNA08799.1 NHL repeat-containing protein [Leptospiraceae bacterium]HNC00203.1 NHL repeat-containing protein [Leptospiraceae bacterium]
MNPFYKTTNILIILTSLAACTKSSNSKDKNILVAGLLFLQSKTTSSTGIGGPTATRVYGQAGSFTTATSNKGGISADSLYNPEGITLDSSGGVYIADRFNNRVLYYPTGSTTATRVYGQNGSFTSDSNGTGNVTASTLSAPRAILLDSTGGVYISCGSRVLYYTSGSTTASRVYGQLGVFTTQTANTGGVTANSLGGPTGLALDSSNGLYISDSGNDRVLYYPSGSTTATRVYGTLGSFTSSIDYRFTISADSLYNPTGLLVDSSNGLYIADSGNNRILYFPSGSIVPSKVYGQSDFTSRTSIYPAATTSSVNGANYLVIDKSGGLYVSGSSRVIYFPSGSTIATKVYGQGGSFTTTTVNNGGISANSLSGAAGLALDASERLYVVDTSNNRVLYY